MSDLPGLVVDIEARIDKLEKGLKRANEAQNRASGQMEARAKRSADRLRDTYGKAGDGILATFKRLGPGLLGGLVGGAAVGGLAALSGNLGRIVTDTAMIGDEAKRAGVSVQALQEWKFVGQQNRIGIDQVVDGLKELNLRADEFIITSTGPAAEAFGRLGLTAGELKTKLEDPSELLLEIMGRMEDLNQAARIRISDELFGGSAGERFAELVSQGEAKLRDTIRAAHDTGVVLDSEVITKAAELDRRFAALQARADSFVKTLVLGIADAGPKILELGAYIDNLFDNPRQGASILGDNVYTTLSRDARAVEDHRGTLEALARAYDETGYIAERNARRLAAAAAQLRALGQTDAADTLDRVAAEMRTLIDELDKGTVSARDFETRMADATDTAQETLSAVNSIDGASFGHVINGLGRLVSALATAAANARALRASLPGALPGGEDAEPEYTPSGPPRRGGHRAATPGLATSTSPRPTLPSVDASFGSPEPDSGGSSGGSSGGGSSRENELQREIQSISEETAALRLEAQALADVTGARLGEADALDYARTKAELLAAAQRAGVAVTPELRAQIDTLAREYTEAGRAAELAADRIEEVQNASRAGADRVASVFEGLATGAMNAKQAVGQLILEILKLTLKKRMLDALENAGGGGLFGGILRVLGGGFAAGGYTGDGARLEPAGVVHRGEYVVSAPAVRALGVDQLEALHTSALRGYSGGGLVSAPGAAPRLSKAAPGAAGTSIEINAPITVNASGGTPEANADLARRMSREVTEGLRGVVVEELTRQLRPGNILNRTR